MTLLVRLETAEEGSLRREAGFEAAREVLPYLWRLLPTGSGYGQFVETVCALDPQASCDVREWAEQQVAA